MIAVQVIVSGLIVLAVLLLMWRLPAGGENLYGWAPPMALGSAWAGMAALIISALLWFLPFPDVWLTILLLAADPAALALGVLVLWIYRKAENPAQTIQMQRLQARAGVFLGLLAVAVGYAYVMTHKTPFTPVGV